ncbi:MAG: hypothetical protein WCS37_14420 [Chloroflexota bacterium]|nr:hypothetical protein [Chloroflexota bacterium]
MIQGKPKARPFNLIRDFKNALQEIFYFVVDNSFLIFFIAFFTYWTFFAGKLNWAMLVLVVALFLMIIGRVVYHFREKATTTYLYRAIVLLSATLLITALCIQTLRFIFVFTPGLSEPTLPKILVRIGVATTNFYLFALLIAFVYYLYTHGMTKLIWNGSLDRLLKGTFTSNRHQNWRQIHFSNNLLIYTFFGGGVASVVTLSIGLVAWLLR